MVEFADQFSGMNKVMRKSMLVYGIGMMRETLIAGSSSQLCRTSGEDHDFAINFSKVMNEEKISGVFNLLDASLFHLERNANAKIEFLNLSLSIAEIFKSK